MMKDWVGFSVDQVLPYIAFQYHQFVFLSFTMDEKAASSIAFGVHDLTDPHTTDPASFLWEPSPAGVISGHNHSLDTHNIAVIVWVCFFGHFPVHLDACPAAGSFAPFIFLSAYPPSSHLRRSPHLAGMGGGGSYR